MVEQRRTNDVASLGAPDDEDLSPEIPSHQLAAVASPGRRLSDLVGNFAKVDGLLEQLGQPEPLEEGIGPQSRRATRKRVGSCPAAHNHALLGERRRGSA